MLFVWPEAIWMHRTVGSVSCRGIMPQLALRAVPMAGTPWRHGTVLVKMPAVFNVVCLELTAYWAPMLASLHRRLPGDVTLPNDARFIDWVAVVYSCWADLAGGSKGRSNGHPWSFIFPCASHCPVVPCCPMLSRVSIEAVIWSNLAFCQIVGSECYFSTSEASCRWVGYELLPPFVEDRLRDVCTIYGCILVCVCVRIEMYGIH